jgi:hypothetical protein
MIEGSGSGSIPLTSGSGSLWPKNMWIRIRIRIRTLVKKGKVNEKKVSPSGEEIPGNGARTRQAASAHCLALLAVQYARTDIRKQFFAVREVEGWNRLPDQLKTTASKDAFKRMLRKYDHYS